MAKKQDTYTCTECGWTSVRWVGRCGECNAWGTVVERGAPKLRAVASSVPSEQAVPISQVPTDTAQRKLTTIAELDRVLGDGLVPGAVVLLAGEPGVGKSTLLLDVAAKWARSGEKTLYISGEESASQVRLRAERTGAVDDALYLASETDLGTVLGHMEQVRPTLLVLDSVQTISTAEADGAPGGPSQVREITAAIARVAKRENMAAIIVGHVTKDGAIAGPRTLEHLVDVVLTFEGDKHSGFRMVRATKNRYGPADEVGCFEMNEKGIVEVPDPSGLFTTAQNEAVPGTCVTVTMEGRRPLLSEIQALVAPSPQSSPRRTTHGLDGSRLAMVLAVLERKVGLKLSQHDVYASTVGGARVTEPSVDLAVAIAVVTAALDRHFPLRLIALGEVGLAGDLRRVPGAERRLAEAARLGFEVAIIPTGSRDVTTRVPKLGNLQVIEVPTLSQALIQLKLADPVG
ncbi:DNA repair protein RadA [Tessaracoccus massiliensis]|uniref:DNA repair protein RadA n=1 Tax=Tessaracoccus massiliensis TaxID=1522311 RepID=UPI00058DB176|nr:DNA repair protein RadA [Tessaracoccus massiliensis]